MNLKNPELFRSWLIRQLEPICKANPEPVSKYVCALLKKEKSDGELKQSLISQLYIFLDTATEEFVNFLIEVLENESYLNDEANFRFSESTNSNKDENYELETKPETEAESPIPKEERKSPSPIQAPTPSPPKKVPFQKSFSPRSRRNRFRIERRRRIGVRRSRRDNSSQSDSPPTTERRTITRKRSASGSSESSTKSPRRSWIASRTSDVKKYKNRNFTRSPLVGPRSRSASPKIRKRKPTNGNFRKRPRPNSPRSNSDDDRNHIVGKRVSNYQNDLPPRDIPAVVQQDLPPKPMFNQKQRCVDFEGKGYCARGDMCPYDHGPSPIVLDNSLLNGIVPLPPAPPIQRSSGFQETNLYTPQYVNTNFSTTKSFRSENPSSQVTKRELISVPTIPLPQKPKNIHAGKPSHGHIFSSLPPGVSQTTIELTNVPSELNNIPDLYEKFSSFGTLTLIQVKRNGDANTALLTFTNATEAALAFINVDTVISNVKAAWYADKCILKPFPRKSIPASGNPNAAKSFMLKRGGPGTPSTFNTNDMHKTIVKNPQPPSTTVGVPKSEVPKPALSDNKTNEVRRQDPGRLLSDLIKKKRELLEKQLSSRKVILEKLKSLEVGSADEKTWQDVLKKLNTVITENENSIKISLQQRKEYLQKMNIVPMDSVSLNNLKQDQKNQVIKPTMAYQSGTPITKGDTLEESELDSSDQIEENVFEVDVDSSILNQEFEKEKDINDSPLKNSSQHMDNAKCDDKSSGVTLTAAEYTRVLISGFENGDEEELIEHFKQFGKILDKEIDTTIPSATLIYDNRKSAEDAKKEGRNFLDRLLSVTVYGSKKHMPPLRRIPSFKGQYEEYTPVYQQYSGNPYKYKNPQIGQVTAVPTRVAAPNRSVYSYRAEQKTRLTNMKKQQLTSKSPVENNTIKLTDDEDLVTFLKKGGIDEKEVEKYMD